jgi:branched-chain amino acid aminotransferase
MAPFSKTDVIWMNGELVPWADANVHVSAHALQYGTGVFEGMRSYDTPDGPAIFRLEPHMRRLIASASYYELTIPYTAEELCDAALDVLRANRLENAYFRPLAFFDSYSFSVWPKDCPVSVAIISVPGRAYLQGGPESGVRVTVSTVKRIESSTLPPHIKASGHYTNSVLAVQEAIRRGYDDALLFNARGDISEGSGANLMIVRGGTLITNDVDASILPGITRDSVLQIARDLGIPVTIRPMSLPDVQTADEVFFCGTAVEVTPIREIDGRTIGDGTPGPITQRIQRTFYDAVHGRLTQYKRWLSTAAPVLELAK